MDAFSEWTRIAAFCIVALGIWAYITFRKDFKKGGEFSKEGKSINKFSKEKIQYDVDISALKALHKKGILTLGELEKKVTDIKAKKKLFMIEYHLENSQKYKAIIDAQKKGFIDNNESLKKISNLRIQIEEELLKNNKI